MTLMAAKFTPKVLLSAPRRSAGAPNCTGEKILYTVTTYSFEEHRKTSQIRYLDAKTGQSTLLYENPAYSEPTWITEDRFIFLKNGDKGTTTVKEIKTFRGSISNLKAKRLSDKTVALACSVLTTPEGKMFDSEAEEKPHSSAKVYTSLFVRHWDAWVGKNKQAVWYGSLELQNGKTVLAEPGLVNAHPGTGLECPVPPFGGSGDFDICASGIAFVAKDPHINEATHTKTDLYYVPLKSFTESKPPKPQQVKTGKLQGYSQNPTFSPDGKSIAFTRMRSIQYESDKTRLLVIPDVEDLSNVQEFFETEDGEGGWDYKPDGIAWSHDGKELYITAEFEGTNALWKVPSSPADAKEPPTKILGAGSVTDFKLLSPKSRKLFVTTSSLVDNSSYSVLDPRDQSLTLISSSSKQGKSFGLSKKQCSDFWCKGAGDYKVHALVMKPSNFDESKKYPLAFLIHGGPQGAWGDSWSTRWNPAIFAEQGYVVVTPNPTGSSGYGMALQNGIKEDWGGKPYNDLVNCFEYIGTHMPYVDMNRAVALGASYGGYMINWIQGHPLGRKFKALVCHDGVFCGLNQYCSEELFFPLHDFGGTLWDNRATYEKWDPSRFTGEWATPQLVRIHPAPPAPVAVSSLNVLDLDYRLPITEGLAAFNVLQSRGVPSKFLTFPDENHWVLKPENSLVWHKEVLDWINRYASAEGDECASVVEKTGSMKI
ncbi:uncharacterized protein E0L32_011652 [Thyridium curvatum]|uniref:Dipeptidyl-peptidase V n=1 Tax=Thyridium curvatum TaxID=1093900 RepID=A0A507BES2_9PEZI|nr:uncharacterized protein E0L32_011652 [Thyridium curvatum]TPX18467.1 hypothetical protein E0L32_011652 [Thyridium curvatum]